MRLVALDTEPNALDDPPIEALSRHGVALKFGGDQIEQHKCFVRVSELIL